MKIFEIRCGKHLGKVRATGILQAWRRLTRGNTRGLPPLAKIRQLPDGQWFTIEPWLLAAGKTTGDARRATMEEMG